MMTQAGDLLELRVASRRSLAIDIIEIELVSLNGAELPPFDAGAHIDVHVAPSLVRQYSICNDPRERHRYRLGVLLDPNSRGGSKAIHTSFESGQTVFVSRPRCNFRLSIGTGPVLLLGGGIGITPLISMAYELAAEARPFALHYCTRSSSRAAYLEELGSGTLAHACNFYHDDSPPEQRFSLKAALAQIGSSPDIYICGPEGFIDFAMRGAAELGVDASQLHIERFKATVDQDGDSFTVFAEKSGVEVKVKPGASIAKTLMDAGVRLNISCEQGICGTCLTPVLQGIPDHRDQYLTDEEKAANNQMTPCCSRSLSPRIVLAL